MDTINGRPRKKRKSSTARTRVTRACDVCKRRKLRCSGTSPCSLCLNSGQPCQYTAEYTRGKLPVIPQLQLSRDSTISRPRYENAARDKPSNRKRIDGRPYANAALKPFPELHQANNPTRSSRSSPDIAQTDVEGHYVGPSSGASFPLRVLKRLQQNVSEPLQLPSTSIFSFGDAPLPPYDPYFLILPTRKEAMELAARYFDFAFPTHRFLHRPTVEVWFKEFYDSIQNPQPLQSGEREVRALLLMVLAQAKQYTSKGGENVSGGTDIASYFGASEHHLGAETGAIRLTSVQARLAQCFYLLSQSRINHAWSLLGTTARLASAIGLHRRKRREICSHSNVIEHECRKRVFWCMYSLDNYLSAALGRPRNFHEEDIDQDLPACVDDSQITSSFILPATSQGQSLMLAPVYHAKLSKIINGILRDFYGIKKTYLDEQVAKVEEYSTDLAEWRKEISTFLDLPNVDLLVVIYQRQYHVLNLAHAHARLLLLRPFLLRKSPFSSKATVDEVGYLSTTLNGYIEQCLQAASKIVSIFRSLVEKGNMYQAFWFTHYYVFSAVVVLYVYVLQTVKKPKEMWAQHFEQARQAQRDLAQCGGKLSFAQRYVAVLSEFENEIHKLIEKGKHGSSSSRGHHSARGTRQLDNGNGRTRSDHPEVHKIPRDPSSLLTTTLQSTAEEDSATLRVGGYDETESTSQSIFPDFQFGASENTSPSSIFMDLTDWGDLDSLVTIGLGNGELEHVFGDNFSGIPGYNDNQNSIEGLPGNQENSFHPMNDLDP